MNAVRTARVPRLCDPRLFHHDLARMPLADPSHTLNASIVGAGAVGTVLARRLVACDATVDAVVSRRASAARRVADRVGARIASDDVGDLPETASVVFVCVPDDAIADVARALAQTSLDWSGTVVAHTSGARPARALSPLDDAGAALLSFHPMQTFTPNTPSDAFEGIVVGVEGDAEAVTFGTSLAQRLGARPVTLTQDGKTLYHCAASLASNGLVALMAVVREVLAAGEVDAPDATTLVQPLVEQTWANLTEASPEAVLTGPVARGDQGTVEAHLDALRHAAPHLTPVYAALATEMTRVAIRSGDLPTHRAEAVLEALSKALGQVEGLKYFDIQS